MTRSQAARRALAAGMALLLATLALSACAGPATEVSLPPEGAAPDYQLGAPYPPSPEVGIVARDRSADPVPDVYSICYINAFQTQPGELDVWPEEALLADAAGEVVFDPAWPDEALLDTSSEDARDRIADIVEPWIRGCADSGFDAVEFDNLDTYARSDGALTLEDNLALAEELVEAAHNAGLAAGQKNAAEDSDTLHTEAGFDFAVAEECLAYDECDLYRSAYGTRVVAIEYADTDLDFAEACEGPSAPASVVLRDRELVAPGKAGYVFALCDARRSTG